MFTNPEQFASATKAIFEFQVTTFNMLTSKTIESVEQVLALNMATGKAALEDSQVTAKQFTEVKDPQAMLALTAAKMQPPAEEAAAYNTQLTEIITEIKTDFTNAADAHITEAKNNLTALIHDVTKNVPPGSENAVAIVKVAIQNAFTGYEQVTKATKQAVATVEAEVTKATEQFSQLNKKQAPQARAH
jgi:phasin family protein